MAASNCLEGLVQAHLWPSRIIGPTLDVQHVLHPPDELRAGFWRDAPLLVQPGLERIFWSVCRTGSGASRSAYGNSPPAARRSPQRPPLPCACPSSWPRLPRPAARQSPQRPPLPTFRLLFGLTLVLMMNTSRRSVHRSRPSGGWLQARAIKWASPHRFRPPLPRPLLHPLRPRQPPRPLQLRHRAGAGGGSVGGGGSAWLPVPPRHSACEPVPPWTCPPPAPPRSPYRCNSRIAAPPRPGYGPPPAPPRSPYRCTPGRLGQRLPSAQSGRASACGLAPAQQQSSNEPQQVGSFVLGHVDDPSLAPAVGMPPSTAHIQFKTASPAYVHITNHQTVADGALVGVRTTYHVMRTACYVMVHWASHKGEGAFSREGPHPRPRGEGTWR